MVCKSCEHDPNTGFGNDLEISAIHMDKSVPVGGLWNIYVDIYNNSWISGDNGKICIYEGDTVITQTETFELGPDKTIRKHLSGIMPDHDLYLNVSVVKEWSAFTRCEDGFAGFIKMGPFDPAHPGDTPPQDEESVINWIKDNLVLVLVLILIIIIMLKFG